MKSKTEQIYFSKNLCLVQKERACELMIYTQRTEMKNAEVIERGRRIKLMLCLEESLLNCKKVKQ